MLKYLYNFWLLISIFGAFYATGSWIQDIVLNNYAYKGLAALGMSVAVFIILKRYRKI